MRIAELAGIASGVIGATVGLVRLAILSRQEGKGPLAIIGEWLQDERPTKDEGR
jgi:hypothetical protein